MEKLIKDIASNQSEVSNTMKSVEEKKIENEDNNVKNSRDNINQGKDSWKLDNDGQKALKNTIDEAEMNKNKDMETKKTSIDTSKEDEASKLSENLGLQGLTSFFKPQNVKNWRKKLEKLLDIALGMDIVMNPNRINKKIEDAPPGMEEEIPDIKNIAILLDCSGSMGYQKFVDVCKHLSDLFKARKLNRTKFHLIPWGDTSQEELKRHYKVIVGSKSVLSKLATMKGDMGGTDGTDPFAFMAERLRRIDAIIVLTDAGLYNWKHEDVAVKYIRKHQKRVIWVVVDQGVTKHRAELLRLDRSFHKAGRYVEFKKGT